VQAGAVATKGVLGDACAGGYRERRGMADGGARVPEELGLTVGFKTGPHFPDYVTDPLRDSKQYLRTSSLAVRCCGACMCARSCLCVRMCLRMCVAESVYVCVCLFMCVRVWLHCGKRAAVCVCVASGLR